MEIKVIWVLKLILAHCISDFWWQPTAWVIDRNLHKIKSKALYWHIAVTGITALLFIGIDYWKTVLFVVVTHWIIDLVKVHYVTNFKVFLLDQCTHLLVILIAWSINFNLWPSYGDALHFYETDGFWIYVSAVFFLTIPASIVIGEATKQWTVQPGLRNAGKYIGIIERIIICALVYQNQYEAIGLLITGKSILRYNNNNNNNSNSEEVKTEYLLVGTLLSIFIAFVVGLLLKFLTK